jgi:L-lactate dehydrogenase complex protein LldG
MSRNSREEILKRIKEGLYHSTSASLSIATPGPKEEKSMIVKQKAIELPYELELNRRVLIGQFIEEVTKVNGSAKVVESEGKIRNSIMRLVEEHGSTSFTIWESDLLKKINLKEFLERKGLKFASPDEKEEVATVDIGITEADFAIADMGTLVLIANDRQPRSVSLIPPIHAAILRPNVIFRDIHHLFAFLSDSIAKVRSIEEITSCMTFITGPSKTADIELTLTLGVHGPKELFVLVYLQ